MSFSRRLLGTILALQLVADLGCARSASRARSARSAARRRPPVQPGRRRRPEPVHRTAGRPSSTPGRRTPRAIRRGCSGSGRATRRLPHGASVRRTRRVVADSVNISIVTRLDEPAPDEPDKATRVFAPGGTPAAAAGGRWAAARFAGSRQLLRGLGDAGLGSDWRTSPRVSCRACGCGRAARPCGRSSVPSGRWRR